MTSKDLINLVNKKFNELNSIFNELVVTPYSYSRLSTFESCITKFFFNYINEEEIKIEEIPQEWSEKGVYIHSLIDSHFKLVKFLKTPFLITNTDEFNKFSYIANLLIELPKNFLHTIEEYNNLFIELNRTKSYEYLINQYNNIETEKYVEYKFNNKIIFRGYIDLLLKTKNKLIIFDWKTGKTKDYKPIQLALYAFMLINMYPEYENIQVNYYLIQYNEILINNLNTEDIYNILLQFINIIKNINEQYYLRGGIKNNWNSLIKDECEWCSYKSECIKMKLEINKG